MKEVPTPRSSLTAWERRYLHMVQRVSRMAEYGVRESASRLVRRIVQNGRSFLPRRRTRLSEAAFFARCGAGVTWKTLADPHRPLPLLAFREAGRLRRLLTTEYSDACRATVAATDRILSGSLRVLGFEFMDRGRIRWNLDPWSGTELPQRHRLRLRLSPLTAHGDRLPDFMFANEVNKHTPLLTLGKAFFITGDERYAEIAVRHMRDWIEHHPVEVGIAYCSTLTVAQRIMTWIFLWATLRESRAFQEDGLRWFLPSLCLQADFLASNLSVHWTPRNNFYLTELTALAVVGAALPELREAEAWLRGSMLAFQDELLRQVWPDGVSVEQSVGYQRLVIDVAFLMLTLRGVLGAPRLDAVARVSERLAESHMHLLDPQGQLTHIGDVSTERAVVLDDGREFLDGRPTLSTAAALFQRPDMKWVAGRFHEESAWLLGPEGAEPFRRLRARPPDETSRAFPSGGYYVLRSHWGDDAHQLIIDAGWTGMGPDGPGGHGHNDTLAVTLTAWGEPILVDPGTYIYRGSQVWRDWFRSTAAHNAVTVDGEEMGLLGPGLFEIRQQPRPRVLAWRSAEAEDVLIAEHSGYHRLDDPVTHRRTVRYWKPDAWTIEDECLGEAVHTCEVRFHCAPEVDVSLEGREVTLLGPRGRGLGVLFVGPEGLNVRVEEGWVSRSYGHKVPAPVLVATWRGRLPARIVSVLVACSECDGLGWRERARHLGAQPAEALPR